MAPSGGQSLHGNAVTRCNPSHDESEITLLHGWLHVEWLRIFKVKHMKSSAQNQTWNCPRLQAHQLFTYFFQNVDATSRRAHSGATANYTQVQVDFYIIWMG